MDGFLNLMIGAARWAAATASHELLRGDEPVEASRWHGSGLPPSEVDALLTALGEATAFTQHDHMLHLGQPQIPADRATHSILSEYLKLHNPAAVVVGEEATAAEWEEVAAASAGAEIFVLDAIDGSGPFEDLTFGFGSTIIHLNKVDGGGFRYNGSLTSNASGFYVVQDRLDVFVGNAIQATAQDALQIGAPLRSDTSHALALVSARPDHRSRLRAALDWDHPADYRMYTTGGAPAALGIAIGRLDAIVCPAPQATWDAAYLPALADLGCAIALPDGRRIDRQEAVTWLEMLSPKSKPIPPFIVTTNTFDHDDAVALLRAISQS